MYVGASLFSWIQGSLTATAVQRLSYGLRGSVEQKLHVLPSSHFEEQRRGDVLSRATNDVDNISQALNQLLNQLIMSVLMLSAALAMMLWLSPLLALIAVLSVPVSTVITVLVARHSQAHFKEQWSSTGALHAQLEEFFTGHEVVKAFGRQEASAASFRELQRQAHAIEHPRPVLVRHRAAAVGVCRQPQLHRGGCCGGAAGHRRGS